MHTLSHIHNFESFVVAYNTYQNTNDTQANLIAGLLNTLSNLPILPNGTYLNPIRSPNANTVAETFKLASGLTGIAMCLILGLFASSASEYIRRSFYNLFWCMHQVLSILFLIALFTHGIQGIIKSQTNVDRNNPQKCYLTYKTWSSGRECDIPQFAGSSPTSYIWVCAPLAVYLIERLIRFVRGLKKHRITKFALHPSNVLELQIDRNLPMKIKFEAGQYIYLNYPAISKFEWHPFTVTSAPDDEYVSVHIRSNGDWTNELAKTFKAFEMPSPNSNDAKLDLHIDGPYGSCAEDVFTYSKVILIGAGIGVTPYASILKHISNMFKSKKLSNTDLNKVFFFWICPNMNTFEWFGSLLKDLEQDMNTANRPDLLEYKIYLTKGWSLNEARQIAKNEDDIYDLFTGLQQKTFYGRPNFDTFLKDLVQSLEIEEQQTSQQQYLKPFKIGVFFCGPSELSHELHVLCNKYSNQKFRFFYNKENF